MNGIFTLYLDQYGNKFAAHTVNELRAKVGGGRVGKICTGTRRTAGQFMSATLSELIGVRLTSQLNATHRSAAQ